MGVDLDELLTASDDKVRTELKSKPDIHDVAHDLDLGALPIEVRKWHQLTELVAVVADLKNSSQLDIGKHPASTASIYEAAVRPGVDILSTFNADDMDIQGDAVLGMFWGDKRFERAICAAITLKTFSLNHLQPRLDKKWASAPRTGFKVGVASGGVLVKRLGRPRDLNNQEEVWVGKPVNYAAKAAQQIDRGELLVTASIWDRIEKNDYLKFSCGCGGGPSDVIWTEDVIKVLPDDQPERNGRKLTSRWCDTHGAEFCDAILSGSKHRDDVADLRAQETADRQALALLAKEVADLERKSSLRSVR